MLSMLASFASVMTTIGYVIVAILVLMLMITIHELGHYTFGKKLGFKINEFAIGFGKAIYKKTMKSGEIFSIRIIPLGGYCAFAGEDEDDADPGAFNNQKPWKRLIVQFGGVFFNFLSAILFAFILLIGFGYDVPKVNQVDTNFQTTIQTNDIIREIDNIKVDFITDNTANSIISNHYKNMTQEQLDNYRTVVIEDKTYKCYDNLLSFTIQREGEAEWIEVQANLYTYTETIDGKVATQLYIGFGTVPYQHTFGEALARCVPLACAFAWKVLVFLWMLLTGGIGIAEIGGPFTTISTIAEYSQQNIANLFVFLPFISANLAIFNILPIPSLDGARMVFTTIEWIRGKPINRKVEGYIHTVGLFILFALVIFVDLYHLFI